MFITNLFEAPGKTAVVAFGRLNPPTIGHKKLVDMLVSTPGDAFLFLSHTQKPKDNPLSFAEKKYFAEKFFPGVRIGDESVRTPIDMLKKLWEDGYKDIVYVAGSDRVEAFTKLLNDYNSKEYSFDSIKIISAGERDPDAEGVEGMSASKMRAAAKEGDFASFKQGVPVPSLAKELYDAVRKGMKIVDEAKPGFIGDGDVTEAKKPARGTLAWEIQQRERQEYLRGFAQDPHGNKTPADELVGGPSGTSKKVKESMGPVNSSAIVIKTKSGKEIGEVYPINDDDQEWAFLHYALDLGEEYYDTKEEAMQGLKDMHLEYTQNKKQKAPVFAEGNEADRIGKKFDKRITSAMSDQEKIEKGWQNPAGKMPLEVHRLTSPYEGSEVGEYTVPFPNSPKSAQRFASYIISKGGEARIARRGMEFFVFHKGAGPISKEEWRKSESKVTEDNGEAPEANPEELLAKVNAAIAQKKAQIEKEVALYNQLEQTNEAADNKPRVRSYLNKQGMRKYEVLNSKGVRVNSQEFDSKKSALEYMMSKWPTL